MRFSRAIYVCLLLLAGAVVLSPRLATAGGISAARPIIVAQLADFSFRPFRRRRGVGARPQRFRRPDVRRPFFTRPDLRRRGDVRRRGTQRQRAKKRLRILGASLALSKALQRYPGSKPLGVRLLPGREPVYAVRLRRGDRIIIMRVNAVTGAILR